MASRLLLLLLATLALLFAAGAGQAALSKSLLRPFHPSCSTTDNYTAGSEYKKSLNQLLAALPAAAGDNGWFYKGSAGGADDEVFGLIMCYADYDAAQCLDCLSRAPAGIRTVCPGSRNVSAAYDACVLRYSSAPIPATADLRAAFAVNTPISGVPLTSEAVRVAWLPLMTSLSGGVALAPSRIFSTSTPYSGSVPGTGSQEMYGLAQCSRDLNGSECTRCITSYTKTTADNTVRAAAER